MNSLVNLLSPELIEIYGIDLNNPVIWKEERNLEWLKKKKKSSGTPSFYKSYQNKIIQGESALFKQFMIDDAKERGKDKVLLFNYVESQWTLGPNVRVSGVDLAISQKSSADWTVITTIAGLKDGSRIILNIVRGRFSPAETREHIVTQYQRFKTAQVKVESVAYQASLVKDMKDFTAVPIKAYNTGSEKFDEYVGLNSLATEFENGKWILPYGADQRTRELIDILCDEMLKFGPDSGHTGDVLMSLWFANTALREIGATQTANISIDKGNFWNR